ncbi:MAG: energy transducer TonB [Acidobacteriota bacterium]
MGKVFKYCSACQENFTEKFSFCPNCSAVLNSHQLIPLVSETESFNVTFIEGKSSNSRKGFLLGSAFFVLSGTIFSLVGSIYNADAYVNGLDDSLTYIASISESPTQIELEMPDNRKEGDGSGGGGGGRKDKEEVSKGELPPQFKEPPLLTPSKEDISVSNPTIAVSRATKGPQDIIPPKTSKTNGIPESSYEVASNGYSDSNLGMGRNVARGIGNDGQDGVGSKGKGGVGDNEGDKYGDKIGTSENGVPDRNKDLEKDNPPKIKPPVGVTIAMKITAKPRAIYTDDARKNQRAGTVTLRVTFMANGSIGNVAVINGLPDGLTENAIAAAKNIQFEPAKVNGIPQTVTKQVQYTFTLY